MPQHSNDRPSGFCVVVSGNTARLEALCALLGRTSLRIQAFANVESALKDMAGHAGADARPPENLPALIVADLCMPGIDGWQFCRLLRSPQYPAFNEIPILILSLAFAEHESDCIAAGLGAEAFRFTLDEDGDAFVERVNAILQADRRPATPRVLIIEGDKAAADALQQTFTAAGYPADIALDPQSAVGNMASTPYDLVVLSDRMLDDEGPNLLDKLTESGAQHPSRVTIMMATNPKPEQALDWMMRGVAAYLPKPFEPDDLLELCAKVQLECASHQLHGLLESRTDQLRDCRIRHTRLAEKITDYVCTVHVENGAPAATKHGPGCQAVTGFQEHEFDQSPYLWLDMVLPEDRDRVIEHARRAAAAQDTPPIEHRIVRRDGKTRWVRCTPIYHRDARGALTSYDSLIRDITEHKRLEKSAQDSQANLLSILDSIDEPVYVADPETYEILFVNNASRAHFGEGAGSKCYEYLQSRSVPCPFCTNDRIFGDHLGRSYVWEFRNEVNGRWYKCIDKAIRWPDGRMVRYEMAIDITERKRAEEALKASEERLNLAMEVKNEGIWDWNLVSNETSFDDRYYTMAGYAPGEFPQDFTAWAERVHPDDALDAEAAIKAYLSGQSECFDIEFRFKHKNGSWIWIQGRGKIVARDEHGAPMRMIGTHTDITDRKRAEESLRNSQRHLQSIFSIAPTGIGVVCDRVLLEVNKRVCEMTGYCEEELVGKNARILYPTQEDYDYVGEEKYRQIRENGTGAVETRWRHKDGAVLDILLASTPLDQSDMSKGVTFTALDITERKRAETEISSALSLLNSSLESTADGILVVDRQGSVALWNRKFADMWRIPENILATKDDETLIKTILSQLVDPEQFTRKVQELYTQANLTSQDTIEFKDGRVFERYSQPQRIGNKIAGRVWSFRDVTERKHAEQERQKIQEQLNQAQRMESVGRLAGGVAHDFNNMLGVILGRTELALEQTEPAGQLHNNLQEIRRAAERSAALTTQLLAFARKQTVEHRVFDLNESVALLLEMLRRLIGENIDLVWAPGEDLGSVKMDPSQVDQILANLCVNARDAIDDTGKITIETASAVFDEAYCAVHAGFLPGRYVMLAVSDDGCGMDPKLLSSMFEPFFTTKEIGKGTGLGLPMVYGIVKQNSGFINVYSEPGQGTTFRIYLPRHDEAAAPLPKAEPMKPGALRGHETVLLVEDEAAILSLTTTMLERFGYKVLPASTPSEAIRLAEEHKGAIHLLMTDVVMPEMNGRDLARHLQSLYPELRPLFMSGYTANVIAHRGVLDEGVHFIQKPFTLQDLARKVREALGSK